MKNQFDILYMSSDEEDYEVSESEPEFLELSKTSSESSIPKLTLQHPNSLDTVVLTSPRYSPHTPDEPPPKKPKLFHKICPLDELLIAIGNLFFKEKSS